MLCDKCIRIHLPHLRKTADEHFCLVKHYETFQSLLASAENGCEICLYFRPFIEHAKARRQDLSAVIPPQYSYHEVFSNPPGDPFEEVPYGPTGNLIDGFNTIYGGSEPVNYSVQPGRIYQYDDGDDKYHYLEEDEVWTAGHVEEHSDQIEHDDAQYDRDFEERLRKLQIDSRTLLKHENSPRKDVITESEHILATDTGKYEEVQWMLASKARRDGPEQLWIRLSHRSDSFSDLETSANDDFCMLTLTAGSVDTSSFPFGPEICLNGTTYTTYTLASIQPELWMYKADLLPLWDEYQKQCLHPSLEFYQRRDSLEPHNPNIHSRDVITNPGSYSVLELARSWLNKCTAGHKLCELSSQLKLPRRLIDVGDHVNGLVMLHIVSPEERDLPYAALSHCWGADTGAMTRLVEGNLTAMKQEIKQDSLAKSFQDAIEVTRGLHLQYLWIDALCIIQDSTEDWAAEAAEMGQYYRGAAVTVCAVSASQCQDGILRPRSETHTHPKIETNEGAFYLRPLLPDSVTVTDAITYSDIRKPIRMQPWNSRAWTLQERLFSRRIIYFTDEQMVWQCKSRFFAEDGQHSYLKKPGGTQVIKRGLVDIVDYRPRVVGKTKKVVAPTVRSMQWYNLVRKYTQRSLTFARDRLPALSGLALSGLAREVHTHTKATYAAGLWVGHYNTTIIGLMWRPVRDSYDGIDPPEPMASPNGSPSWSWTSLVAEIEHPLADDDEVVVRKAGLDPEIISAKTIKTTSDPFGAVEGGVLVVKCWTHSYAGIRTFHKLCRTAQVYDWAEKRELRSNDPDSPNADFFATFDLSQPDYLWKKGNDDLSRLKQVCLAFIAYTNPFEDGENPNTNHAQQHFLLLEKIPGDEPPRYRRVGVAVTESGTLFSIGEENQWKRNTVSIV